MVLVVGIVVIGVVGVAVVGSGAAEVVLSLTTLYEL